MTTITLPASIVLRACEKHMADRDTKIAATRERMIADSMRPRFWGLLRPRTRDEAIAYLKRGHHGISDWQMVTWTGGSWATRTEELRDLAQTAYDLRGASASMVIDINANQLIQDWLD